MESVTGKRFGDVVSLQEFLSAAFVIIPVSLSVIIPAISEGKTLEMNVIFGLPTLVGGMFCGIHMSVGREKKTRYRDPRRSGLIENKEDLQLRGGYEAAPHTQTSAYENTSSQKRSSKWARDDP